MAERSKAPVLKTGDVRASVGSNPTLSANNLSRKYIFFGVEKYPSGRRGSPAKGVDVSKACEGSNPSFSASSVTLHPIRAFGFVLKARFCARDAKIPIKIIFNSQYIEISEVISFQRRFADYSFQSFISEEMAVELRLFVYHNTALLLSELNVAMKSPL